LEERSPPSRVIADIADIGSGINQLGMMVGQNNTGTLEWALLPMTRDGGDDGDGGYFFPITRSSRQSFTMAAGKSWARLDRLSFAPQRIDKD